MNTNVSLEAVWEAFEDHVHVNAIGVGPSMLKVLLQPLFQGIGDLVELVELAHPLHGRMVAGRARVQPLDDGADISENTGVHESCK